MEVLITLKESQKQKDGKYLVTIKNEKGIIEKKLINGNKISTELLFGESIEKRFFMHEIEKYEMHTTYKGMNVKIKKLIHEAIIPKYAKLGDAGLDLTATSRKYIRNEDSEDYIEYGTGLAIEIPIGYVGLLFPRSSNSKVALNLANCVGVIDSGYRGEITLRFKPDFDYDEIMKLEDNKVIRINEYKEYYNFIYNIGDRIGQLIILPYPQINLVESEELSDTDRGTNGYGSTGN